MAEAKDRGARLREVSAESAARSAGGPRWWGGCHHLAETHPLEVGDLRSLLALGAYLWGKKGWLAEGNSPKTTLPLISIELGYRHARSKWFRDPKTNLEAKPSLQSRK